MLIKDLEEDYPLVYKAAVENYDIGFTQNQSYYGRIYDCPLETAFNWHLSKQGFDFWAFINNKKFDKAKEICPELFKEDKKYYDDLSQHIGRYIKALVDAPSGGYVKKGEIGKIINKNTVDFPFQSNYRCGTALSELNKSKYELMPKDYKPEEDEWIPKVGDWVIVNGYSHKYDGIPLLITKISKCKYCYFATEKGKQKDKNFDYTSIKIRKALPHEIPKEELNTYGLKVGDKLPQKVINAWCRNGINYYDRYKWVKTNSSFINDRVIKSFKKLDGEVGFEVSGTWGSYLKAKGFKEFMENFNKPKPKFKIGDKVQIIKEGWQFDEYSLESDGAIGYLKSDNDNKYTESYFFGKWRDTPFDDNWTSKASIIKWEEINRKINRKINRGINRGINKGIEKVTDTYVELPEFKQKSKKLIF